MPVIVFGNQKGGVGKTLTAFNLAGVIANQGKSVVVIDTDATESLNGLIAARNETNQESATKGVKEVPFIKSELKRPDQKVNRDIRDLENFYDYVIVDTAGSANEAFKSAIGAADVVYLPFSPCKVDMDLLAPTIKVILEVESYIQDTPGNEDFKIDTRLLLSKVDHNSRDLMLEAREIAKDLLKYVSISSAIIKEVKKVKQCQSDGITLSDIGHKSRAMYEVLLSEINGERAPAYTRAGLKVEV